MSTPIEQLPSVATKYGIIRFHVKGERTSEHFGLDSSEDGLDYNIAVVIAEEDGGLVLPDGRTYVTPQNRSILWNVFKGTYIQKKAGGDFPVKAKKQGSRGLEHFSASYSVEAQEINDVILEAYLSGAFDLTIEDPALVREAQTFTEGWRTRLRTIVELEEEAFSYHASNGGHITEAYNDKHPGTTHGYYILPSPQLDVKLVY